MKEPHWMNKLLEMAALMDRKIAEAREKASQPVMYEVKYDTPVYMYNQK